MHTFFFFWFQNVSFDSHRGIFTLELIQHEKILLYKVSVQKRAENLPRWNQLFIIGSAVGGIEGTC
jgi:hypothetical protein